jgi:hypothetical protein
MHSVAGRIIRLREVHLEQTTRLLALARNVYGLDGRLAAVVGRG